MQQSITTQVQKGVPGAPPPGGLYNHVFEAFVDHQMASISVREIVESTAGVVAVCAFFMGANSALAKLRRVKGGEVDAAIVQCLVNRLGMANFNAVGLISANERLAKKYKLIDNMQQQGVAAAKAWQKDEKLPAVLPSLVAKGRLLTLSDLDAEGLREMEKSFLERLRNSWLGKLLFWLVVLAAVATLNLWFFGHSDFLSYIEQLDFNALLDK